MNAFLHHHLMQQFYRLLPLFCILCVIGTGCIEPPVPPAPPPPVHEFAPVGVWVKPTYNCTIIDVSRNGNIVAIGNTEINHQTYTTVQIFSPEGTLLGCVYKI